MATETKKKKSVKLRDTKPAHDPKGGRFHHRRGRGGGDDRPTGVGPGGGVRRRFLP